MRIRGSTALIVSALVLACSGSKQDAEIIGRFYNISINDVPQYAVDGGEVKSIGRNKDASGILRDFTYQCRLGSTVTFYLGESAIGSHPCASKIYLADLRTDSGEPLSENQLVNMSWLMQILSPDQNLSIFDRHTGCPSNYEKFVGGKVFSFSGGGNEFVAANNVRQLARDMISEYEQGCELESRFFMWDTLGIEAKVDRYVGTQEEAAAYYYSANTNRLDERKFEITTNLESGFPYLDRFSTSGLVSAGSQNSIVVGNVHGDSKLEIMINGYAQGPLLVIDSEGNRVNDPYYLSVERIGLISSATSASLQNMVSASEASDLFVYNDDFNPRPGWPLDFGNRLPFSIPPVVADFNGDGKEEFSVVPYNKGIHIYDVGGNLLQEICAQSLAGSCNGGPLTQAVGDFDNDGDVDIASTIVGASRLPDELNNAYSLDLYLFESDGSVHSGFPLSLNDEIFNYGTFGFTNDFNESHPSIGDVDGDGVNEIVVMGAASSVFPVIKVISLTGEIEHTVIPNKLMSVGFQSHHVNAVLADLNGDKTPEIIARTKNLISVFTYSNGELVLLDGWPQRVHEADEFFTSLRAGEPLVGDVDGDSEPDIVTVVFGSNNHIHGYEDSETELLAFNSSGELLNGFPKSLNPRGIAPRNPDILTGAIADIDLDGRNEIVIGGEIFTPENLFGYSPAVYVYDMGGENHGRIHWGQYGADAANSRFYRP